MLEAWTRVLSIPPPPRAGQREGPGKPLSTQYVAQHVANHVARHLGLRWGGGCRFGGV